MKKNFSENKALTCSMDVIRKKLVTKANILRSEIIKEGYEGDGLIEAFDNLAYSINALNCVYSDAIKNFSDLTDDVWVNHMPEEVKK